MLMYLPQLLPIKSALKQQHKQQQTVKYLPRPPLLLQQVLRPKHLKLHHQLEQQEPLQVQLLQELLLLLLLDLQATLRDQLLLQRQWSQIHLPQVLLQLQLLQHRLQLHLIAQVEQPKSAMFQLIKLIQLYFLLLKQKTLKAPQLQALQLQVVQVQWHLRRKLTQLRSSKHLKLY